MLMPKLGQRLTDWRQGTTFIVAKIGRHATGQVVADELGNIHRLDDCMEPSADYQRLFTEAELNTMASAVEKELAGDASQLLPWLGLLSPVQKAQLWRRLHPQARAELTRLKEVPHGSKAL